MPERRGGARAGAGRPRASVKLDKETQRELARLRKIQQEILGQPDLTQEQVVKQLIHEACQKLDAAYEQAKTQAEASLRQTWQQKE